MGFKGYDFFVTEPNAVAQQRCRVCGSVCLAERRIEGATGWIAGLAGITRVHDRFTCPHAGAEWHRQALLLAREEDRTASNRVRALIRADRKEVVAANLA